MKKNLFFINNWKQASLALFHSEKVVKKPSFEELVNEFAQRFKT